MRVFRRVLLGLLLLLALLVAAAAWFYPRLPGLLETRALAYLRDYGVTAVELGALRLTPQQAQLDRLRLIGHLQGRAFDLSLSPLKADYHWRELLQGMPPAVHIESLELDVQQEAVSTPSSDSPDAASPLVLSSLLPAEPPALLPLASLDVASLRLDYRPVDAEAITVRGSLSWDGTLLAPLTITSPLADASIDLRADSPDAPSMELALRDDTGLLADLKASLNRLDAGDWRWDLAGEVHHAALLAWLRRLDEQGILPFDLSVFAPVQLDGATRFEGAVNHPDELHMPRETTAPLPAGVSVRVDLDSDFSQMVYAPSLPGANGAARLTVRWAEHRGEVDLGLAEISARIDSTLLQLPEDTRRWLGWGDSVPLHWRNTGPARLEWGPGGRIALEFNGNRLQLGEGDSRLRLDGLELAGTLDAEETGALQLRLASELDTRLRGTALPRLRLALDQRGSRQVRGYDLSLGDVTESLRLSAAGEVNLDSGEGSGRMDLRTLDLPYAAGVLTPLLRKFDLVEETVNIEEGSFEFSSELRSAGFALDQLQATSSLRVEGLTGDYGEYGFGGVDLDLRWRGLRQWRTTRPATLQVASLDIGFDITDTNVQLSLPKPTDPLQPRLRLEQFSSAMFGGRVYLPEPQPWDFSRESNSLVLRVEDWRLSDLVALQQGQDIRARGVLEGELPITVTAGRLIIEKGYLKARPPGGSIRYVANAASEALASGSSELELALALLEDFRYEVLSSEVDLDSRGNLLLGLSLEGSNPARYDGRAIRFNINLEQNLDPLLQSLRLSDSLVEKVEKRVR